MQRSPELAARMKALIGALLALCFLVLGAEAGATTPILEVQSSAMSAMDSQSMPAASDCAPCALCCVAPAPATHGFSGGARPPEEPSWHPRPRQANRTTSFDTGGRYIALPVRVAFCRWLD